MRGARETNNGRVTILGAGPSGLSAAINLAREGYAVEVFERRHRVGARFNGDLQGMENWSSKVDVRKRLDEMGIQTNFDFTPFNKLTITNLSKQVEFDLTRPAFYLVRRGPFPGTLDYGLAAQARELGVRIHLGKVKPETQADIIATGSIPGRIFGSAKGITFQTTHDDLAIAILADAVGHRGYAYLLITNGRGSLCSTVMGRNHRAEACFRSAREAFSQLVSLDMINPRRFAGVGSFSAVHGFQKDGRLYVGEAAGIQDLFWGFGMNHAIASGYIAARSISRGEDYERAATNLLGGKLKAGMVNRMIWEAIHLDNYSIIVDLLARSNDPLGFLHRLHSNDPLHRALYPVAKVFLRFHYPQIV